jgi:hypothetical protein
MQKKAGEKLEKGEVKKEIISYILKNKESVSEPDIRKHLQNELNIKNQGSINNHLHTLADLECIESVTHKLKKNTNYWDITKLENLKNIRREFSKLQLHEYEKAIGIVLRELEYFNYIPNWITVYLKLRMSTSFFNTCVEMGHWKLDTGVWGFYIIGAGSDRHQRIDDLLGVCYHAGVKHHSEFKMSEIEFSNIIKAHPWDVYRLFAEDDLIKWFEETLPGLPKEIPQMIFKTKLLGIGEISEKIPNEIDGKDIPQYILEAMRLIVEENKDFELKSDDLLFEHFLHHDILVDAYSPIELYFLKRTKENHTLPRGPTVPWNFVLREAELADLSLASEMIFYYKQPSEFSFNTVEETHQALLEHYSFWQIKIGEGCPVCLPKMLQKEEKE